jgi:hypothetical protein
VHLNLHLTEGTDLRAEGHVLDGRLFAEVRWGLPDATSRLGDGACGAPPVMLRRLAELAVQAAIQAEEEAACHARAPHSAAAQWEPRGMTTTSARQPLHQPDQPQQPKGRPDGHHQPHPPLQLWPPGRRTPGAQHAPDLHRGHQHLGDAHRHQQPIHRGGEYATATLGETVA